MPSNRLTQLAGIYRHTDIAGHVVKFMAIFKNPMRYIRLPSHRNRHKLILLPRSNEQSTTINMFKLAVFAAILAVAFAAPGGLTGVAVSHGVGPIIAPAVVSHGPALSYGAHVIAQPVAPAVHVPAVVTRTVLAGHGLGLGALHG